jgi:hypothetical protein
MTLDAELEKRLTAQIEDLKNTMTGGQLDQQQYQRVCGCIQSFQAVIDLLPEIRKQINEAR